MTGIHVLLCAAIILNMAFVYFVYKIMVSIQMFAYNMKTGLKDIDDHVSAIAIIAKEIHSELKKVKG